MTERNGLVAGLLLACMYLAGTVTGFVLDRLLLPAQPRFEDIAPPSTRRLDGRGFAPRLRFAPSVLAAELDLSQDQERQIRQIFDRRQRAMADVMASMRPAMEAEFNAMDREIRALLTDEQAAAFDEFLDDGFGRFGGRRPPPGQPGSGRGPGPGRGGRMR